MFQWYVLSILASNMFFPFQIAYWLHILPELYFQKVKKVSFDSLLINYLLHGDAIWKYTHYNVV